MKLLETMREIATGARARRGVDVATDLGQAAEINRRLVCAGFSVAEIAPLAPSMEQIFFKLDATER